MARRAVLGAIAAVAFVAFLAATVAALPSCAPSPPAPEAAVADAGCRACHAGDPGPPHAAIGCVPCHGGDGVATTAAVAHGGLEAEPGALDTVDRTCGTCHADAVARVRTVPMTTGRGMVGVDRWTFGELPTPDTEETLADVLAAPAPTPGQEHLRKLCGGCHLGTRRANRDDAIVAGGSGCGACHAGPRAAEAAALAGWPGAEPAAAHPRVDARVPDTRCLGCHSRSSRISLSYAGIAEVAGGAVARCEDPVAIFDGRPGCREEPDAHARAGLACVDCHLHTEVMGDGVSRAHQEAQLEVTCEACHGPGAKEAPWSSVSDVVTAGIVRRRGATPAPDATARLGKRGTPLWNLRATEAGWVLRGKDDGRDHPVPPTPSDAAHAQGGHARLTCSACHAAWAPTCSTCHTERDPAGAQWDFGAAAKTAGAWVERGGDFDVAPPALGVRPDGKIAPAIPGMIATLATDPPRTVRRFSLLDPHTTARRARACADCHRDGRALGLGTGTLDPEALTFSPRADDGWTTLGAASPGEGTRVGARSLDAAEQRRVLRVGVCLRCHDGGEALWSDFAAARARRPGSACRGPTGWWDAM